MVLEGFNISKFSVDTGLMDDTNSEIIKENIFDKVVNYEANAKEKTFRISSKVPKDKECSLANFCEITVYRIQAEDVSYGINSLYIHETLKTAVQEKTLTELNKMLSIDSIDTDATKAENA